MARAKEKTLSLLGSATVDLAAAAAVEKVLYTVPSGKKAIPVMVVARTFDEIVNESVVTLGKGGGDCNEFLNDQDLTNITAGFADECLILQPLPNATPVAALILDAAETLSCEITTQETTGSATCVMDVWGYEYDA
ncbi:unnamed protein product [marine sediment metagenome]|uniref:Uncharacterized protein n=1 Tax=marine sediment metagenome TaxID=412755 RepID=X0UQX5_9ZZZZ